MKRRKFIKAMGAYLPLKKPEFWRPLASDKIMEIKAVKIYE